MKSVQKLYIRLIFSDKMLDQFILNPKTIFELFEITNEERDLFSFVSEEGFKIERSGRQFLIAKELYKCFSRSLEAHSILSVKDFAQSEVLKMFFDSDFFLTSAFFPSIYSGLNGYENIPKFFSLMISSYYNSQLVWEDFSHYLIIAGSYSGYQYYSQYSEGLILNWDDQFLFLLKDHQSIQIPNEVVKEFQYPILQASLGLANFKTT